MGNWQPFIEQISTADDFHRDNAEEAADLLAQRTERLKLEALRVADDSGEGSPKATSVKARIDMTDLRAKAVGERLKSLAEAPIDVKNEEMVLAGAVRDEKGAARAKLRVQAIGADGTVLAQADTGPDGRYQMRIPVAAGRTPAEVRVVAATPDGQKVELTRVVPVGGKVLRNDQVLKAKINT